MGIKRTKITNIVCPKCNGDELQYTNELGTGIPNPKRPGWFCYGCKRIIAAPKRIKDTYVLNKEEGERVARGGQRFNKPYEAKR